MEGSDNIITVEFGKGNPNKSEKEGVDKKVIGILNTPSILHRGRIFIDENRLQSMHDSVRNFFDVLQKESYIEIHASVNNLDQSSYLIFGDIKGNIYTISMNDFISVLSHYQELSRLNGIELEDILENFFEEQGKEIHIEYFSPREFLNKTVTMRLPLMDHRYDPIFVKDDYFYSIQTQGDDVDILRVSPEAVLDSNFRDHDLLLMIAQYLEQVYSDSLRDYNDETQVEIIKYDYGNSTTYIEKLTLADLTGFCITEIRDRNTLIQGNDIKKIITNYLNRTIIEQKDADIIPLGK